MSTATTDGGRLTAAGTPGRRVRPAPHRARLFETFWREMLPYEGRFGRALRMAFSVVIVVVITMTLQVPEAVLSCYLIFFASRNDAGSGMAIAGALIVAVSAGIGIGILVMQLSLDEPMLRLGLMAAFTFGGMFMSQASRLGPLAATAGFVFAFALSLVDILPIPYLISHALSWIWVVVFLPMVVLILVNALVGPSPAVLARRAIANRLDATAALLNGAPGADIRAQALLDEGFADIRRLSSMASIFSYHSKAEHRRVCALAPLSQEMLALALAAGPDPLLAGELSHAAEIIGHHKTDRQVRRIPHRGIENGSLADMARHLEAIWNGRAEWECPAQKRDALLAEDAFTNPVYAQFAFKTVIAVFTTYAIYTAWDWFEIHTAMITCFYVALGSTGETLHKASLRIAGALVGGALGIAAIVFLMPHMTDIGHLMLLAGIGAFVAAWVANGSSLVQYMGWQMALAFFLCIMPTITTSFVPNGFAPVFDTGVAINRVMGILVGNAVVALVFLSFWPASVSKNLAEALKQVVAPLRNLVAHQQALVADAWSNLAEARRLAGLSFFEVNRLRMRSPLMPHVPAILAALESATGTLALIRMHRQRPRFLFGAPCCAKAALSAHESAAAAFLDRAASAIVAPEPQARSMLIAALDTSASTLERLQRLAARKAAPARWHDDLMRAIGDYRRLQADCETAVKGLV